MIDLDILQPPGREILAVSAILKISLVLLEIFLVGDSATFLGEDPDKGDEQIIGAEIYN